MRILVLSDAHGDRKNTARAIEAQKNADKIILLGDGCESAENYGHSYKNNLLAIFFLLPETVITAAITPLCFYYPLTDTPFSPCTAISIR